MTSLPSWPRLAFAGAIALICLMGPSPVAAQEQEPDPDIFGVTNNGREIPGSLDVAIEAANDGSNTANVIQFVAGLEDQTLILTAEPVLPAINMPAADPGDPETNRSVDLDATEATNFEIRSATDVGENFTLLHVASGTATLVNLDIQSGAENEEGEILRGQFRVDEGAALGFRYAGARLIEENITGDGKVIKEGAETLRLLGENNYLGGTEVKEGELLGNQNSLRGDFVVEKDAQLTFEDTSETATHLYGGAITGEGKLVKQGDHILQVQTGGSLGVAGGIEIQAGTINGDTETICGDPENICGDIVIGQGALLNLVQSTAGEFASNITGSGKLEKGGLGDLTLSGTNTFSGGIEVVTGVVKGNSASLPGDIQLKGSSSRVHFVQSEEIGDGTHSGTISGEGALIKSGPRTLTLTGTSTYAGDTEIEDGTLRGDTRNLVGDIILRSGTASIEFAVNDTQTFSRVVKEVTTLPQGGNFIKSGSGVLTLTQPQTYSGATEIRAGTLRIQQALSSTTGVTVESGATLENAALAGDTSIRGDLVSRGHLVLGGLNSSFRVNQGGALFESGSTLAVQFNDLGFVSELRVDNAATLEGLEIVLTATPGNYDEPITYNVIFASEFVDGWQAFTTPEFAFLEISDPAVMADGPDDFRLTLTVTPSENSLVNFAQTPNQSATASAMNVVLASGSADADELQQNFSVLGVSQVPGVLDQLAGESLGAFTNAREANAQAFAQALSRRFSAGGYAPGPIPVSRFEQRLEEATRIPAGAAGGSSAYRGGWLEAVGLFSDQSGEVNASDIQGNSGGLSGGFDAGLPGVAGARLGLGFGYTRYALGGNRGLSADGNTYQTALYGSYEWGRYHLGLAGRYAYSDMETERHIAFEDIDRLATARMSGHEAGFLLEAGARLGERTAISYRPLVRLQYNHLEQGSLQETGAGDLSLSAESLSADSWQTTLGAQISKLYTLDGEFGMEPELRVGWTHTFGDLARPVNARFYAVPGAQPFVTYGAENDADQLFVGAGYLMTIGEIPLVGLDYDFHVGDGYQLHVVSAQLYLRW